MWPAVWDDLKQGEKKQISTIKRDCESMQRKEAVSMPQMNKGGKYIFGMSVICNDGSVQFPT